MSDFFEQVYAIVDRIPYGKVVSYGEISWMLGRPRSAREVGRAMRFCPEKLPCHRVVRADGSIAGGPHAEVRKILLENEGIVFLPGGRVDMKIHRWSG
ncbi:ogt: methylated-DNA-[protein]-cysteine S-methyltransferase [Desulfitobacterium hafniense]|uniref:Ogt: methylated-DNA-[protein]-cysteine S-methyltransferase n=1 Tax=Desulfitobacterium hafniense TaxID=49338 RepID=A0A098B7T1_DESHA|nr:MGMT family protein [Desulfitobacterium hafniense]CDX04928.1 ogt: methylated-DNA-[protein]-cysteine S-methyltransferase [Desulfitobacterium hafniense]